MKLVLSTIHLLMFLSSSVMGSILTDHDNTSDIENMNDLAEDLDAQQLLTWWNVDLAGNERSRLMNLFDNDWFTNLPELNQAAYANVAHLLYDFVENSNEDSHPHDSYHGFSPLLLRASFHGAGSLHIPSSTGGTNGGTMFHEGELEDGGNACIDIATNRLVKLLEESGQQYANAIVSKADTLVIAGSVALDTMDFPRMDLLPIVGGRVDTASSVGVAHRDRLPSPDDNPLDLFSVSYGLSPAELTALIGGAHNFGSAHGVCTGYVGQWTSNPLSWKGSNGSEKSEFFTDLIREDWRWYEVCTYKNGTSTFVSIDDPFANGGFPEEEEEEHEDGETSMCSLENNEETFICEEQAMRGCEFADGTYGPLDFPCDSSVVQFRLKSDFFLKADPSLRPHTNQFADDDDYLAEQFAVAYHKLTHAGLNRCGLTGNLDGCSGMYETCVHTYDDSTGEYLKSECQVDEDALMEAATKKLIKGERGSLAMLYDDDSQCWELGSLGSIVLIAAFGVMSLVALFLAFTLTNNRNSATPSVETVPETRKQKRRSTHSKTHRMDGSILTHNDEGSDPTGSHGSTEA